MVDLIRWTSPYPAPKDLAHSSTGIYSKIIVRSPHTLRQMALHYGHPACSELVMLHWR
jgi:hypothetical protein